MMRAVKEMFCAFIILIFSVMHARAESFYSVASLTILCGSPDKQLESACGTYIRAVVEAWMAKDVVSVDPYIYSSQNGTPTYCDAIGDATENAWIKVVRIDLRSMQPGFASAAVMHSLSKSYCKYGRSGR
jgi:hypothetical protein